MNKKGNTQAESRSQFDYVIDCKKAMLHPSTGKPVLLTDKDNNITKDSMTFGFAIATVLSEEKSESIKPMKAWLLSQKFFTLPKVGLDVEDFGNVKRTIEASSRWVPFIIGQLIEYMEGLKRE